MCDSKIRVLSWQFRRTWLEDNQSIPRTIFKWDNGRHIRFIENFLFPIEIWQFVHVSEVVTGTLVGVDTVKSYGNKETGNFKCLTHMWYERMSSTLSTPNFVSVIMYFVFSFHLILLLFYFFIFIIIIIFCFIFIFYFVLFFYFILFFINFFFRFNLILFIFILFTIFFIFFFHLLLFKKNEMKKKREDEEVNVRCLMASWPWSWWLKKEGAGSNIYFQPYPTSRGGKGRGFLAKQKNNTFILKISTKTP